MEDKILISGSMILIIGGTFFFSGVVASGLMTGILGFISAAFLLIKVKTYMPRLWGAIVRYHLVSDLVISGILVSIIGTNTATAIVGSSCAAILTSFGLYLYVNKGSGDSKSIIKSCCNQKDHELRYA